MYLSLVFWLDEDWSLSGEFAEQAVESRLRDATIHTDVSDEPSLSVRALRPVSAPIMLVGVSFWKRVTDRHGRSKGVVTWERGQAPLPVGDAATALRLIAEYMDDFRLRVLARQRGSLHRVVQPKPWRCVFSSFIGALLEADAHRPPPNGGQVPPPAKRLETPYRIAVDSFFPGRADRSRSFISTSRWRQPWRPPTASVVHAPDGVCCSKRVTPMASTDRPRFLSDSRSLRCRPRHERSALEGAVAGIGVDERGAAAGRSDVAGSGGARQRAHRRRVRGGGGGGGPSHPPTAPDSRGGAVATTGLSRRNHGRAERLDRLSGTAGPSRMPSARSSATTE